MNLQTTIIISNSNCSIKTNHRSQFSNFSHPLKVLKKTDNTMLQMMNKNKQITLNIFHTTHEQNIIKQALQKSPLQKKKQLLQTYNTRKSIISSSTMFNKPATSKTINNSSKPLSNRPSQNLTEKTQMTTSCSKQPQYFNQDDGILQHIYTNIFSLPQQLFSFNYQQNNQKCFILFGFSLNVIQLQQFHENHPSLNLKLKFYKYNDNQFYLESLIVNLVDEPFEDNNMKYQQIIQKLQGDDYLDCEELSFVIEFQERDTQGNNNDDVQQKNDRYEKGGKSFQTFVISSQKQRQSQDSRSSKTKQKSSQQAFSKNKSYLYFFPNINALKSSEQKLEQKAITLGLINNPLSITSRKDGQLTNNLNSGNTKTGYITNNRTTGYAQMLNNQSNEHSSNSNFITLTSLRKSHQNFRILQVLEYYLKLQCHSDHIMITSNQSKIIKDFLNLIYQNQVQKFYVFIDHERKTYNRTNKSTARSILCRQNSKDHVTSNFNGARDTPPSHGSRAFTSDLSSQKQFISIDGQLIINDQFLSKLSQIKLPEPWLDNQQFRQIKKQMYKMKVQEHILNKQVKQMKSQFVDTINYLNSLIGVEKVSYEQISLQSLKLIKNGKIKQNTQEVKQLKALCKNLQIRSQELKQKRKQYEKQKNIKDEDQKQNLSQLRKDILNIQKQLTLNRNQINAIYFSQYVNGQTTSTIQQNRKTNASSSSKNNLTKNICATNLLQSSSTLSSSNHLGKSPSKTNKKSNQNYESSPNKNNKKIIKNHNRIQSANTTKLLSPNDNGSSKTQNRIKTAASRVPTIQSKRVNINQKQTGNNKAILSNNQSIKNLSNLNVSPVRAESFLLNRKSSQMMSKYAPVLQQMRKQKYQQSLKQEMTKCQFQAQKQYEGLKQEYFKASSQLKMILNDCD